jgi:hypothetical protein
MDYPVPILLILGGILAASSLIVAKKPNAKDLIAKLTPYQAIIGIALLVFGVWRFIWLLTTAHVFSLFSVIPVAAITYLAAVVCSILLGLMFGMPMLAKVSASGAAKGEEMAKKLAPFQMLIGIVGMIAGLLWLIFILGILKPM